MPPEIAFERIIQETSCWCAFEQVVDRSKLIRPFLYIIQGFDPGFLDIERKAFVSSEPLSWSLMANVYSLGLETIQSFTNWNGIAVDVVFASFFDQCHILQLALMPATRVINDGLIIHSKSVHSGCGLPIHCSSMQKTSIFTTTLGRTRNCGIWL